MYSEYLFNNRKDVCIIDLLSHFCLTILYKIFAFSYQKILVSLIPKSLQAPTNNRQPLCPIISEFTTNKFVFHYKITFKF